MKNHDPDAAQPVPRRSQDASLRDPLSSEPAEPRKSPIKRPAQASRPPPARKTVVRLCAALAAAALLLGSWPSRAAAQDYGAMLRPQQQLMSENIARGTAQQAQRDGYARNQQEAGRGLVGQSTYVAPNGAALALPHTWANGSTHQYQGQTYRVDPSGQYHVLGSNGWWYPLAPR